MRTPENNAYGLEVADATKDVTASEADDPQYGARPLKRVIQQRLQNALANELLAGRFPEGSTIKVDGTLDGFVFTAG